MLHLATEPIATGLKLSWLPDQHDRRAQQVLELEFSRTALGVQLSERGCFACVVGERVLPERQGEVRYWIVLDEAEQPLAQSLFDDLIRLKDRYRCGVLYSQDKPLQLIESLRRQEGISYYKEDRPHIARVLWPSFVDFTVRCGLYARPLPEEETIHRELEMWLKWEARWSSSGTPLLGIDGQPVYRLQLPYDFTNQKIRAGVRQANLLPCAALWLALSGLERSTAKVGEKKEVHEWQPNPISGY